METNTIDAALLSRMFLAGARNLEARKDYINELNVFPVPDGDTGTNMSMTILSAAAEVTRLEKVDMENLSRAISSGSLRGARGNSGVILSQLLRGFSKAFAKESELTTATIAVAMQKAVETAYKAVMKPKEGTILTVARESAKKAEELARQNKDMQPFLEEVLNYSEEVLQRTPEMLSVLKEAGVVDSGGQGLLEIFRGAYRAYMGEEVEDYIENLPGQEETARPVQAADEEIVFGYCTEYIILLNQQLKQQEEEELKDYLNSIGDSLVMVADEDLVKVHVHTNDPGLAIQKGLSYGQLSRMKIDNMREEHQEKLFKDGQELTGQQSGEGQKQQKQPSKEIGFVAVSAGDGMQQIFKELGVDCLIEGGQTMNPSTDDFLKAVEQVPAHTVFLFPNNKNIIMAANQAKEMSKDKEITVIPTETVPQGISAMICFEPDRPAAENERNMLEEIAKVKTGQVTYAVRDTVVEEHEIHEHDLMGIGDHGLLAVGTDMEKVTLETVDALVDEETELISIYYGADIKQAQADHLEEQISAKYRDCDLELTYGGQPVYYFVISVE